MKKLLAILGTITIAGSGVITLVANKPTSIKTEEKILKRTKRWGIESWIAIIQQWRNVELDYQRAAEEFQRTQNHWQFSQAQQRFLQSQQNFNNQSIQFQQELQNWAQQLKTEKQQQPTWNLQNWQNEKINQLNQKVGASVITNEDKDKIFRASSMSEKSELIIAKTSSVAVLTATGAAIGAFSFGPIGAAVGAGLGAISGMLISIFS
ncbi:hypothetical protein [Spiroplasma endosymbiont of Dilophus febrilis]|uniref:hypothetical protein n=1 Tax=Spiroplasma endosymbiont of Dilophus febrilis TaxID=3066292 RepID=UPI00313E374D